MALMYTLSLTSQILRETLFWKDSALLETGTFTSSNGAKLLPGKQYRHAEYERSTKWCILKIRDVSKIALEDFGGFRKVPSQYT